MTIAASADDSSSSSSSLVCVFCGSSSGNDPAYVEAAQELGRELVRNGYGLVYGGGTGGLMGSVAHATSESGGRVVGIMPRPMTSIEGCGNQVGEMIMVDSMHQRKSLMNDHAAAFIALPGGFGTLEELLEMTTWSKLSIHAKPLIAVNTNGYYSPLQAMIKQGVDMGFIDDSGNDTIVFCDTPAAAVAAIKTYIPQAKRDDVDWAPKVAA
ncbi:hypothetical protein IWQ56_004871 [Coemansia nantahalensis]|uniref:Uncharacterized protein n=1 Tax=Coemansia nantahalensis TaxID=2789366 RepID=A0ACC1JM31_9FUNG|nr:hypothetical protein IWQ57_005652 [Coemansia nantahalensis]KAJ2763271.1 hypothetical protein IWQ56_004871 [Coemansia nantahalensis]